MKTVMMIVVVATTWVTAATSNTATTKVHIEGMTCGACATAVKMVLRKTAGVVDAVVSYDDKQATVTYDPAKTSPAKLADAIATALEYKVTAVDSCSPAQSASGNVIALSSYRSDDLRDQFNRASDRVRIVALLSPTCSVCQKGQRVVQSVFSKYADEQRLRGFVVWEPMLATDSEQAARTQASAFVDPRVTQEWDANGASGKLAASTLKLSDNAWDVYLLYAPGVKWNGEALPEPTFWMHQLRPESGADQKICLNPAVFTEKTSELLR
jgi:copper chaperone